MKKISLISLKEYIFITLIFFSISPIITWDGGHYLHYLPILKGELSFENWDIARGLSFPLFIYIFQNILGDSLNSLLVLLFMFYILSYLIVKLLIIRFSLNLKISLALFYIFFVFDILIFNWYHVLLTEFITASIALVSIYLSYEYGFMKYNENKIKFIFISIYFILLIPITYHIKQPYFLIVLLALVFSLFTFYVNRDLADKKTIKLKIIVLVLSLATLLGSIGLWKSFLISQNNKLTENRSTMYFLNKQLICGVRMIGNSDLRMVNDEVFLQNAIKENNLLNENDKNNLLNIVNDKNNKLIAIDYIFYLLKTHPIELLKGYVKNYLSMANLFPHEFYENNAIAYRYFNTNIDTTFYMPPYEKYILNYKQHIENKSLLVSLLENLKIKSDFLFKFLPIFSFIAIFISFILLKKSNNREFSIKCYFILMLSVVSFFHILSHAILGALIDRYVFPVYPLMIIIWILLFEILIIKLLNIKEKNINE